MKWPRFTICTIFSPWVNTRLRSVQTFRALCLAQTRLAQIQQRLGIGFNETTTDGKFTLKEGECMGACGDAPVLLVNNKRMVGFMDPQRLHALIDEVSTAADRGTPSRTAE